MWQEILAIDSRINDRRIMESKDLRPLYLKRRLQLLQAQQRVNPEVDPDQYVMRNKKYISLRVKLLKKQFGLPSDLVSLRSLSMSPAVKTASDTLQDQQGEAAAKKESNNDRSAYNGVHHVIELEAPLASGTRLMFAHGDLHTLICANSRGQVLTYDLRHPYDRRALSVTQNVAVTDFDISDSNELMVAVGQDGSFVVWNIQSGQELRRIKACEGLLPRNSHVTACRFLPRNNNLIICALSTGVLQVN
jgi:WD40 repeat protein